MKQLVLIFFGLTIACVKTLSAEESVTPEPQQECVPEETLLSMANVEAMYGLDTPAEEPVEDDQQVPQ